VPLRYVVAVLGCFGFFCAYGTRGCINVAIVAMVNFTDDTDPLYNSSADRCLPYDGPNVTVRPSPQVCHKSAFVLTVLSHLGSVEGLSDHYYYHYFFLFFNTLGSKDPKG